MSLNLVITGVPGVGATKVSENARRKLGEEYNLVNVGDVMLEEALERGLARSRKELSRLQFRDQRALQRRAGEYIARESANGPLLINTHLVVETPLGYIPGMGTETLREINPSAFVLVDAPPEDIRARREQSARSYEQFSPSISFHKQMQSAAAFMFSFQSNSPVYHLVNDESAAETGDQLATLVRMMANIDGIK